MIRASVCFLILFTAGTCNAAEAEADFYVSVSGSDGWSGTLAWPNAQKSEGPFATLERARDAVRELKQQKATDIVVLVRAGTYQLSDTIVFGCWVENVLEELDEPGEWVLNTEEGKVYLWPRGKSPVFAPTLLELIRVEGTIDKEGPKDVAVRNLCFRGLTFKHGQRYTLTKDVNKKNLVDADSLAVDPMFVDPDNGDFRLKPDSPALKMGIVPFDTSKVGLRYDAK